MDALRGSGSGCVIPQFPPDQHQQNEHHHHHQHMQHPSTRQNKRMCTRQHRIANNRYSGDAVEVDAMPAWDDAVVVGAD
jgi:hypothetical protein